MNTNLLKLIEYPKTGITSKEIIEKDNLGLDLFCMSAGAKMGEHTSTKQGIIQVLEGKGIFNLEGKDIAMTPGTLIHMNKNAVHSLRAIENTSFLLTLVNLVS